VSKENFVDDGGDLDEAAYEAKKQEIVAERRQKCVALPYFVL